ncbi:uncharacterized protein LOC143888386 [Tasmannia lanceolata]|uniref:uncharacterized protein LOC143888386 n=1 Tax=Tasmannia lanceolata TaxID=3420 RepID=UPI004064BCFB
MTLDQAQPKLEFGLQLLTKLGLACSHFNYGRAFSGPNGRASSLPIPIDSPRYRRPFSNKTPFTEEVLHVVAPPGFKMPQLPQYDGTTDPVGHLETFKTVMLIHGVSDDFMCRAYPATLVGAAREWYSSLRPSSVRSFEEFGDQLVKHFLSSRRTRKTAASLMTVKQHTGESLKDFIARFNREALQIPNLDPSAAMNALLSGVKSADFRMSIAKKAPTSLADLLTRAEKYITVEEMLSALNLIPKADNNIKRKVREEERGTSTPNQMSRKEDKSQRRGESPKKKEVRYTPLNTPRSQILMAIRDERYLKWPDKLFTKGSKRDKLRYCRYHRNHGHDIDE